jgi:CheY-like chemotaxis protein
LTNLIFNAADAITSRGQITVRIAEESATAIIEVADDGRGMTSEEQIRCLEPFYTTKSEGTGLGLSVCRGIIKAHGGQMDIDSTAGKGTVVRLRIPKPAATVTPPAFDDLKAAWTDHTRRLNGKRILYVDDNSAARDSAAALLSCLGAVVDVAVDGPSGLARFDEDRYDAVVTDMTMPGMDGLQLTTEIKRQAPTMPVLLVSGWLPSDMRDEKITAKPDCVLSKPFAPHEFTATLAQLLLNTLS